MIGTAGTAHDAWGWRLLNPYRRYLADVACRIEMSGVLADIRAVNQSVRIIMLTARGDAPRA